MEFRILGPLELDDDGHLIDPGSPRARVLLAMLLLDFGRVVPAERLIDAVWDDRPPKTARTQIHICISALRRTLQGLDGSPRIVTRYPGYALLGGQWGLDARTFEERVQGAQAAVDDGDDAGAVGLLREALALWRGEPLAGIDSRLVQASAVRLRERYLLVAEDWAELELAGGRHEAILGTHAELIRAHPYQERLHEQLMLALYRSGRSADALEVFRGISAVLDDDLGIVPGERLRRLERAILADDRSLWALEPERVAVAVPAPGPVPHQLPADTADFIGHADLLASVEQALTLPETAPQHRPRGMRLAVLAGPGGIGKTAYALHVAHRLAPAFPDGQLFAELRADTDPARVLERFLVALGVSAVPADLGERLDLYRSLVADRRMLVVLDNAVSESQLLPLLPGSSTCAVLVTTRRRLTGIPGVRTTEVKPLAAETALELLAKIIGAERVSREAQAARRLVEQCAGLPLAVRVAGARLAARPHWTIAAYARRLAGDRPLDELNHGHLSVRTALAPMVDSLPPGPRGLLYAVSMLKINDFPGYAAAALLDLPLDEVQEYLDVLADAYLLQVGADATGAECYRMTGLVGALARERSEPGESPLTRRAEMVARVLSGWLALADLIQVVNPPT